MKTAPLLAFLFLLAASIIAHAQTARVSDAEMIGIFLVANQAEVAAGQTALRRTQSRSVQGFATRMVSEHAQANQEALALLQRVGGEARRSAISDTLAQQSRDDLTMLDSVDGYDFDRVYLDHETAFLRQLIASVDGFIRTTANDEVRTLFVRSRPSFILQLDQAHRLQIALQRPGFGH